MAAGRRHTPNLTHRIDSGSHYIVAIRNGGGATRTIGAIVHFQTLGIPMNHIPRLNVLKPVYKGTDGYGGWHVLYVYSCIHMVSLHYSVFSVAVYTSTVYCRYTLQIYSFFKNLVLRIFIFFFPSKCHLKIKIYTARAKK